MFQVRLAVGVAFLLITQPASSAKADDEARARDIEQLVAALAGESTPDAVAAADELGQMYPARDRVIPRLREALREADDWQVQASILRALGRLEARPALPDFARALRNERPEIRMTAAAALWRVPDPVVTPALLASLHDGDAAVRQWAATALGSVRDRRSVHPLIAALDDDVAAVRLEAIRSLRRMGDREAIPSLQRHASNSAIPFDEQREALAAILELEEDDVAALLSLMRTADPVMRAHVAEGLEAMATRQHVAELRQLLRTERNFRVRRILNRAVRTAGQRSMGSESDASPPEETPVRPR